LNKYEHSVYAAPIPTPAPRATDAQRVVGLPVQKKKAHVNKCEKSVAPIGMQTFLSCNLYHTCL
jgi:hypothetical protein